MTDGQPPNQSTISILMPVYNDWQSAIRLVELLGKLLETHENVSVTIVNDGSTEPLDPSLLDASFLNSAQIGIQAVRILHLRRNLGHQRAICVGLCWISENLPADSTVVIMDSDGEDKPEDVPRLLQAGRNDSLDNIIFAERTKRSEGIIFSCFYAFYRWMHILLVGQRVRFGNFSVVPAERLKSLVVVPELWNHYAAAVLASRQPHVAVPTSRGNRIHGRSKMNFVSLVIHGLSALSVFSDRIGVRLSLLVGGLIAAVMAGLGVVVGIRVFTDLAIPGWATFTGGLLILTAIQLATVLFVFCFVVLGNRVGNTFLPIRDYRYFVKEVEQIKHSQS